MFVVILCMKVGVSNGPELAEAHWVLKIVWKTLLYFFEVFLSLVQLLNDPVLWQGLVFRSNPIFNIAGKWLALNN